jgi:tRNA1(Val) A37 N6-methylase TrmN6
MTETTLDAILNRRVTLEQPAAGYRVAVDTVLLAAAVPALAGDRILDIGCGVGGAMLAVACRVAGIQGLGIEIQPQLVDLCKRNIDRNAFASGLKAREGDAAQVSDDLRGKFDHVLMNPPYHEETRHDVSANAVRRTANSEKGGDLGLWIACATAALGTGGMLTMIHRADRRDEILPLLQKNFGEIEILPLLPKAGADPKRIILRARKDALFSAREYRGLVLHQETGAYANEAEAILRHCQPMLFQSP